ncbi:MAG: hypothetical protein GEV11_00290 [Streptosporangiales bacterium]|nr:hypothetical protein [Streptosporangiales bacterium]
MPYALGGRLPTLRTRPPALLTTTLACRPGRARAPAAPCTPCPSRCTRPTPRRLCARPRSPMKAGLPANRTCTRRGRKSDSGRRSPTSCSATSSEPPPRWSRSSLCRRSIACRRSPITLSTWTSGSTIPGSRGRGMRPRFVSRFASSTPPRCRHRGDPLSPLPTEMQDRWSRRTMLPLGTGRIYWHVLLGADSAARAVLDEARDRLEGLHGLDFTPAEWLHLTVLVAGLREDITDEQADQMAAAAQRILEPVPPIRMSLSRVLYHPEAVLVRADGDLDPLLAAAQAATRDVTGQDGELENAPWTPHVTLAYSSTSQPAEPVICALGRELPRRDVTIDKISLVNQDGPENLWRWQPLAAAELRPGSA